MLDQASGCFSESLLSRRQLLAAGGAVAAPPAPAAKARVPKSLVEVDNGQVRGLRGALCPLRLVQVASNFVHSCPLKEVMTRMPCRCWALALTWDPITRCVDGVTWERFCMLLARGS